MPNYDYIIIGAGASGLLLADALGKDSFFKDKTILVLDKNKKDQNDRTWCFWEENKGVFDAILGQSWSQIHFAGQQMDETMSILPYRYKMLRGIDFYSAFLEKIKSYKNVDFLVGEVQSVTEKEDGIEVAAIGTTYKAAMVFDSRFDYQELLSQREFPVLQQHFVGWFVKTEQSVFNMDCATFMDFSIPQKGNTRFMYVLPFSENEALLEYTLFSSKVLEQSEYENGIKDYLDSVLKVQEYEIKAVEKGNIPMSCFKFSKENTNRYLKIGIAGGWAKPSTGFTFYNSYKKTKQVVEHLKKGKPLSTFDKRNRFWFYDLLLLDILHRHNGKGSTIFDAMFKKRPPQLILKFLDEGTSFWEEIYLIWACPKWPFVKSFIRNLKNIPFGI